MARFNAFLTRHPFVSGLFWAVGAWAVATAIGAAAGLPSHPWLSLAIFVAMSPLYGLSVRAIGNRKAKP